MQRRTALIGSLTIALSFSACGGDANSDESTRNTDGEVVEGGEVGALRLKVGDCLAAEAIGEVESVPVVPCSEPHDSELFHSFDLADGDYPGEAAVSEMVEQGCLAEFDAFIGMAYADSAWDVTAVYPSEETWNGIDDREVLCGVALVSGEAATGSAAGIAE